MIGVNRVDATLSLKRSGVRLLPSQVINNSPCFGGWRCSWIILRIYWNNIVPVSQWHHFSFSFLFEMFGSSTIIIQSFDLVVFSLEGHKLIQYLSLITMLSGCFRTEIVGDWVVRKHWHLIRCLVLFWTRSLIKLPALVKFC